MIKFIFLILFINFMVLKNKILVFYYNICFISRFIIFFMYIHNNIDFSGVRLNFCINYYSLILLSLSVWIVGLILITLRYVENMKVYIIINILVINLIFFRVNDLILFYMIYEIRLIPVFFLVIYWGMNPERLRASYYLIIYILIVSFPLLVYIFYIFKIRGTLKFRLLQIYMYRYEFSVWEFIIIYLAFLIKIPLYIFHVWLPKAHVEAPVYGSIILAGVLLKMGGYGLIRLVEIFIKGTYKFRYLLVVYSIIGRVIIGVVCLVQVDIKILVAYSSVVHMNIIVRIVITITKLGLISRYILIISHGLCSSGLFYIVNLYYIRTFSRLIILNKGIINILRSLTIWWFIFCIANFSYPFSLNFIREIFIIILILNWSIIIIIYLILVCFFRAAYSLYLYSYLQHGNYEFYRGGGFRLRSKEFFLIILHLYPIFIFIFNLINFM